MHNDSEIWGVKNNTNAPVSDKYGKQDYADKTACDIIAIPIYFFYVLDDCRKRVTVQL